jgi:hypothetical protein
MSPSKTAEAKQDLEVIVPDAAALTVNGIECTVRRLKTREFLALMRVLTAGLGAGLGQVKLDFEDQEQMSADIAALVMLAIPQATEEFIQFVAMIVDAKDGSQTGAVKQYLADDPPMDVLLDVFEIVATQEHEDLASLVGKAQAMWSRVVPLYSRK